MHEAQHDRVAEIETAPRPDIGAPLPLLVSDEHHIILAYVAPKPDADWDGTNVSDVSPELPGEPIAIITFDEPYCHLFGPPNDEVFESHPLARISQHRGSEKPPNLA